ncbi:MAG: type IX secretion system sortase PorU [Bacteroidetes bacterium]|nr:type IX secretion system sortase PorU [Bacteroidota bacterium]
MNSKFFLAPLLLVAFGLNAQSQNQNKTLEWSASTVSGIEQNYFSPNLKGGVQHQLLADVPQFCESLNNSFRASDSVRVVVLGAERLPQQEAPVFNSIDLPTRNNLEQANLVGFSRSSSQLSYCFTPFFKENGQIYRVTSYQLQVFKGARASSFPIVKRAKGIVDSKLATGTWHKLRIPETGIYKISANYMSNNGMLQEDMAIDQIRILANDHATLPESFNQARTEEMQERGFKLVDVNGDNLFNGNDYLLFFAFGPDEWTYNAGNNRFDYRNNIYRDYNYVFVSTDAGTSKSMNVLNSLSNPQVNVSSFDDYDVQEEDLINLVGTGRAWYGDVFEFTLSYNYNFVFPNILSNEPVSLRVDAVGRASTLGTSLETRYANQNILSNDFAAYQTLGNYPAFVERSDQRTTFTALGDNITLNVNYDNSANPTGVAWLDKIELNVRRSLNMNGAGSSIYFRDSRSIGQGVANFKIENAPSDLEVWQINRLGDHYKVNGTFPGDGSYSFNADVTELKDYIAFSGSNFDSPDYIEKIDPQNLSAMDVPEMIIIVHPNFLAEAEELAAYHNEEDNVQSAVVSTSQIYNEFGAGGQDLTAIRDFIKSLYDRSAPDQFKYVLLFGDASYDYKDRVNGNNNYVPTWQSNYSYSLGLSSITDDYFAYMDPGEATQFSGAIMDLGIGRAPVASRSQAQSFVNKVRHYGKGTDRFGEWRNRILLMTDDVDETWERTWFVPPSEVLADQALSASNAFNIEKIYQDAYKQVTSTGSQTYPEAQRDMFRAVQQGCILVNYIGHGGEIGLSSEKLLQLSDVTSWTNYDALSLFITITCEFTRYDDPKRVSAGEQLILNPAGGAIALLSTTRVVGVQDAVQLNEAIFDTILARPNGVPQTLGQIIRAAKNDNFVKARFTKSKFSLIGDPALRLAIPEYSVSLSNIQANSGKVASQDTIKALSLVELNGQVQDANGQAMTDFNGILNISIYDKESQRQTLSNDGIGTPLNFKERNSLLYRGKVDITNGQWSAEFRAPLGINYQFGFGKVSMYAYDNESNRDAAGAYDSVIVGGFNENAPEDEAGPAIRLFMNDASFVRGGITGSEPFIYAELQDSSGINTVGNGIGQDLRAVLNRASDQPIILNEFYEADLNSYKSGSVRYQLFDLEPGAYQLDLRAFDIYNNPSEATTEFVVAESADLALDRVLNYPNPFTTYTEFQFEHNRANQPLQVQVQIFTVSGRLVKTINREIQSIGNRVTGISWNGLDDFGDKIGKGVYVYRIKVKSLTDNSTADEYEKLVILR